MNRCTKQGTIHFCLDRIYGVVCRAPRPCPPDVAKPPKPPPVLPMLAIDGEPCTLVECRPGFFLYPAGTENTELCLKTYRWTKKNKRFDVFCSTGGPFWAGTTTPQDRAQLIVQPVKMVATSEK